MRNLIVLSTVLLALSGCYGGVQVSENFGLNASYNQDSTQVVFYKFIHVFHPAKGLLAFPDGGISKALYRNASLYVFDIDSQELTLIHDYGSVAGDRSRRVAASFFKGDTIMYNLYPEAGWENELRDTSQGIDSMIYSNKKSWFSYSLFTKKSDRINLVNSDTIRYPKVSTRKVDELTCRVRYKEWGVDFSEIYPQTKSQRIAEIAKLKNSIAYRNAIIEEFEGQLSDKEIDRLIKRIDRHLDSQDDYDRQRLMRSRDLAVEKLLSIKKPSS